MPVTVDDLEGAKTLAEAARALGFTYRHMQRLIQHHQIEYVRLGSGPKGRVVITRRALTDYLNRRNSKIIPGSRGS